MLQVGDRQYHHALICLNGHVFSASLDTINGVLQYCEECGKETITSCQKCNSPLLGWSYNPYVGVVADFEPPNFCRFCGKPFPWTEAKIGALKETIDFEDSLSDNEKELMKSSIEAIISETPRTKIASMKFKIGLAKAGKETAKIVRDILVDIASETGKKIIMGPTSDS